MSITCSSDSTQLLHLFLCRVMRVLLLPKSLADRLSQPELQLLRLRRVPWCYTSLLSSVDEIFMILICLLKTFPFPMMLSLNQLDLAFVGN